MSQYWTQERMKNAKPVKMRLPQHRFLHKIVHKFGDILTLGEKVPSHLLRTDPYKKVGKVFFSVGGDDYVCSGSAIGKDVILTAGHCVSDGAGTFVSNMLFVPGYDNGTTPDGTWVAKTLFTFNSWHYGEYFARDVGFVVVDEVNGLTLEQRVGALNISTCRKGDGVISIGYPVPNFGGENMAHAIGKITVTDPYSGKPEPNGMPSLLTEGSSGGPWVSQLNQRYACGLNSYGYEGEDYMYSPQFDETVFDLRLTALDEAPDGGIVITKHPESKEFHSLLGPVTFSVEAMSLESLHYQWLHNDVPIIGANEANYTISSPTYNDVGFYNCKVSNSRGWVYSRTAIFAEPSAVSKKEISLFVIVLSIILLIM